MKSRQSGEVQHAHYPLMAAPIEAGPPTKKEKEAAPAKREREEEAGSERISSPYRDANRMRSIGGKKERQFDRLQLRK
ncbi:hypothetical protein BHE74_00007175 [Ensete ventricosum]|nr:hypothetical protein BHE74_00007175 [Ensete ventricosum]